MNIRMEQFKGKCVKQTTIAIIVNKDKHFIGSNSCESPQSECPRKNMKTGEGYELCKEVCKQKGHAEINALNKAGKEAEGGTLFLIGHYYLCDNCIKACEDAGISNVVIVDNILCK